MPDQHDVVALHTSVAGRARFRVAGLKGSEALKSRLELRLAGTVIDRASASAITGNVLVFFDAGHTLDDVIAAIRARMAPSAGEALEEGGDGHWHSMPLPEVFSRLDSGPDGVVAADAGHRLQLAGPNLIGMVPGRDPIEILVAQFSSLPVALLAASAVLSFATGGVIDALAIAAVIGLNAAIGFATEGRAEQTMAALQDDEQGAAIVVRDGTAREVPLRDVVPGDVVELRAGLIVPADCRLVSADALSVSEALLTGESVPVEKLPGVCCAVSTPLVERVNMVFKGTLVTGGAARAIVVATGEHTEIGLIQRFIGATTPPRTPLQRQLDKLGGRLVAGSLIACGGVLAIGLLRGGELLPLLRSAVSLAVAAVPEGLPTLATTTLAFGIDNLRRQGVLIRRLPVVEGLSSIQLVCFDKTGTLTLNRMEVVDIAVPGARPPIGPPGSQRGTASADVQHLLEICSLCSDAELASASGEIEVQGSSTEAALIRAALAARIDVAALRRTHPRIAVTERAEQRRYMKTAHRLPDGQRMTAIKGSPEDVLALCRWVQIAGERRPLSAAWEEIGACNRALARRGLRVLGVAYGMNGDDVSGDVVWAGLIAMADPLRPDAKRIIEQFHRAGIRTLMITGDQPETAAAIAAELGLGAVNGTQLEALTAEIQAAAASRHAGVVGDHVFSRVTPARKLEIVKALQQTGLIVAMTGDGVNDAPSLRAADIGIALGGGTDAARQTSDVILRGDELEGMVVAIETGRATFENIQRAIRYLIATNLSEIGLMVAVTITGSAQPLTPLQLLWVNLVTDVLPAIGLALEPPAGDLMQRAPRDPDDPVIASDDYRRLARDAALMGLASLVAQGAARRRHGPGERSGAVGFAGLVTAQLLHALRHRAAAATHVEAQAAGQRDRLRDALLVSFAAQAAALYAPGLRRLCGGPIDLLDTGVAVASGAAALTLSGMFDQGRSR